MQRAAWQVVRRAISGYGFRRYREPKSSTVYGSTFSLWGTLT